MTSELQFKEIPETIDAFKAAYLTEVDLHAKTRAQLEAAVQHYREQIRVLNRSYFGRKADIVTDLMFDEAEVVVAAATAPVPEIGGQTEDEKKPPRKQKRKAIPDHLPRTIVQHDLPEDKKICAIHGAALQKIGVEVTEELEYIPAKFRVISHETPKYGCRNCEGGIVQAKREERLIPGSIASPGLIAQIAVSKYLDHLPLYRQEAIYSRFGVELTRASMAMWMIRLGDAAVPIINMLCEDLLESPVVQCDETPLTVIEHEGIRKSRRSYIWVAARWAAQRNVIIYRHDLTRGAGVPLQIFEGYSGYFQVDGYKGYDSLCARDGVIRVGCMAHVRRKFTSILKAVAKKQRDSHPAAHVVKLIRRLYAIEDKVRGLTPDERLTARQSEAPPIFDELQKFVDVEIDAVPPKTVYGTALHYARNELPRIRRYLDCGSVEIDNNLTENAIRPFAVGRKNWLFADTVAGARASANIYTLLMTAKANGLDPVAYLTKLITKLPSCRTADDYAELLPYGAAH